MSCGIPLFFVSFQTESLPSLNTMFNTRCFPESSFIPSPARNTVNLRPVAVSLSFEQAAHITSNPSNNFNFCVILLLLKNYEFEFSFSLYSGRMLKNFLSVSSSDNLDCPPDAFLWPPPSKCLRATSLAEKCAREGNDNLILSFLSYISTESVM